MGGLVIPKNYILLDEPCIFLAGPIRGASNWQDDAADYILSKHPEFIVFSPRGGIRPKIENHVILGGQQDKFYRQREWERHYLAEIGLKGSIAFWLPTETEHRCEKSYGSMTRVELGQIMTLSRYDNVSWCVGTDGGFSDLDAITYDLSIDAPDKDIFLTLEETCNEAIMLALAKK